MVRAFNILDFENKNKALRLHKKKYHERIYQKTIRLTEYENSLFKRKAKKLGLSDMDFLMFCFMKQVEEWYEQEKVDEYKKLYDEYGGYEE